MHFIARSLYCAIFVVAFQKQMCFAKWGCDFLHNDLFTLRDTLVLASRDQIVYGDYIPPAIINDWSAVQELLTKIENALIEVVSGIQYNSFDNILKFYRSVKNKIPDKDFASIDFAQFLISYHAYESTFSENSAIIGLVVRVLNNFLNHNDQYTNNVFLATVYADAPQDYADAHQFLIDIHNSTFKHNHVAGILKINHNNVDGYVVMDPELGITKPILVMQNDFIFREVNQYGNSLFRMLPLLGPSGEQIYWQSPYMIQSLNIHQDIAPTNHLYYVGRSFCSMMYVTYKRDLLNPLRVLGNRDGNGNYIAYIAIDLMQNRTLGPMFTLRTVSQEFTVPFSSLQSQHLRSKMDFTLTEAGVPGFLYETEKVYKTKLQIFRRILDDDHFIEFYELLILLLL